MKVTYYSDCDREYADALTKAESLTSLQEVMKDFRPLVGDAAKIVTGWDETIFADWRKALYLERHGKFMGNKRVEMGMATVLMPDVLLVASLIAFNAGAPWGTAYIRLKETGRIATKGGNDYVVKS